MVKLPSITTVKDSPLVSLRTKFPPTIETLSRLDIVFVVSSSIICRFLVKKCHSPVESFNQKSPKVCWSSPTIKSAPLDEELQSI